MVVKDKAAVDVAFAAVEVAIAVVVVAFVAVGVAVDPGIPWTLPLDVACVGFGP